MVSAWLRSAPRPTAFCVVLSAAALILSFLGRHGLPADPAWIAIVLCGAPILYVAGRGIAHGFDIRAGVLVSLALIAALLTEEYFAAGEVALIMQIGTLLEDWTVARARAGIEGLARLSPQTACRLHGGAQETIAAEDVRPGDLLLVRAGATVPVDGTVTEGETAVDASLMTGESLPVDKHPGDIVVSGTVNTYGTFTMRADKISADSSLQRMIVLARAADAKKAPIVRLADRWASWLVGIALACALLVWWGTGELGRGVTVLVVFCPCAFVLATPTAVAASIGNLTRSGILIRTGDALERLACADAVAFDKTGTLTHGTPVVVAVQSLSAAYTDARNAAPHSTWRRHMSPIMRGTGRPSAVSPQMMRSSASLPLPTHCAKMPRQSWRRCAGGGCMRSFSQETTMRLRGTSACVSALKKSTADSSRPTR